jgi:hypothetical protein
MELSYLEMIDDLLLSFGEKDVIGLRVAANNIVNARYPIQNIEAEYALELSDILESWLDSNKK